MEPSSRGLGKTAPYRAALFSPGHMVPQSIANLMAVVKAGFLICFFETNYLLMRNEVVLAGVVVVVLAAKTVFKPCNWLPEDSAHH